MNGQGKLEGPLRAEPKLYRPGSRTEPRRARLRRRWAKARRAARNVLRAAVRTDEGY